MHQLEVSALWQMFLAPLALEMPLTKPRVSILRWQPDKKFWGVTQEGLVQQKCPRLSPNAQILALKAKGKVYPNVSGYIKIPQRIGGTPVAGEIGSEGNLVKEKLTNFYLA